jgi:hypothetical protein
LDAERVIYDTYHDGVVKPEMKQSSHLNKVIGIFSLVKAFATTGIRFAAEGSSMHRTEEVIDVFKITGITSDASTIVYSATSSASNCKDAAVLVLKVTQSSARLHQMTKVMNNRLKGLCSGYSRRHKNSDLGLVWMGRQDWTYFHRTQRPSAWRVLTIHHPFAVTSHPRLAIDKG